MKIINDTIYQHGLSKNNSYLFAYGRNAIYSICKSLNIKKGDEVLTPALDCDSTITPFIVSNASLVFYKSDPFTFEINLDDLVDRITENTRLIHIINHFGIPQPWDKIEKIKTKYEIPILEDNAFSFFTKIDGKPLGSFGDFSIFSLYKIFQIIDGGLLINNNENYKPNISTKKQKWICKPERKKFYKGILLFVLPKKIIKIFKNEKIFLPPIFSNKSGYPIIESRDKILYEFSYDLLRPISKFSIQQLKKYDNMDIEILKNKIKYYYDYIVENLDGIKDLKVLNPLIKNETVPFCVMILLKNNRDDIIYKLINKGYHVMAWPNFSKYVLDRIDEFQEIGIVGKKIIQININSIVINENIQLIYFEQLINDIKKLMKV